MGAEKEVILSLGTNLGDRHQNLRDCIEVLENKCGKVIVKSSVYESKSWGFDSYNFYNANVVVRTELSLEAFFEQTQRIEKELGRKEKTQEGYEARLIDIDILFYEDYIVQTDQLTIPHKEIKKRLFVLIPLKEIKPGFRFPGDKREIEELIKDCDDSDGLKLLKNVTI